MSWSRITALVAALILGACGPTVAGDDDTTGDGGAHDAPAGDVPQWGDGPPLPDGPPPTIAKVYAHSSTELYQVDPDTLEVTLVGTFQFPGFGEEMTDIALDKDGNMVGISYGNVYAVDKTTAVCTYLAALDRDFNALSFIPGDEIGTGQEILVGASLDGWLYHVDEATGASNPIGSYGAEWESSGDIVSVTGFGTVATAHHLTGTDWLVRIDPNTGAATPIGDTGYSEIWGLGFWKGRIFGFTNGMQFVLIDKDTGAATLQQDSSVQWWGAGVTTSAPVID